MAIAGFQRVGVIGSGQMGSGIAQVAAAHSLSVVLADVEPAALERSRNSIDYSLGRMAKKGKLTDEEHQGTLSRIQWTSQLEDMKEADIIIEAVSEKEDLKATILSKVDKIVGEVAILASNTSSIPITRLASHTSRPDRFIGMHFMNPVPVMRLVEIIDGMGTSEQTSKRVHELAVGLGKEISRSQDYPGFVVNRILMPLINESFGALMEGVASAEDIDKGARFGLNHPMGPLALADLIGLDTCLSIMQTLHQGLGDPRYRPCPLLTKYVEAGYLGRKSGRGVYEYES